MSKEQERKDTTEGMEEVRVKLTSLRVPDNRERRAGPERIIWQFDIFIPAEIARALDASKKQD